MSTEVPSPGWYADPENPDNRRYWDGQHWLLPADNPQPEPEPPTVDDEEHTGPTADDVPLERGWYTMPDNSAVSRYWNGKRLASGDRTSQGEPELPRAMAAADEASSVRRFLWTNYILGALIPIYGWGAAIYVGVSEKYAAIRRHAIGIAAVALAAAAIYAVVIVSVNKSHQDRNVAADLQNLLQSNGVFGASNIDCAHQAGNLYQCSATINGQQEFATVTDDGHTIYEQGISTNGGG